MQESFGRDASNIEASASQRAAPFDAGGLQPELRRSDRANVSSGSGANDHNVVVRHSTLHIVGRKQCRRFRRYRVMLADVPKRKNVSGLAVFRSDSASMPPQTFIDGVKFP